MATQQQIFLQVKEKLDYYRLPTIFPIQCTALLSKLLAILEKYRIEASENVPSASNISSTYNPQNVVQLATRKQISLVIKENNELHMQLMTCRQEIQSLKHCIDKITIQKSSGNKELEKVIELKTQRETQLLDQILRLKFRYNQILDMVHQDPNVQKMYIKRLLKHNRQPISMDENMKQTTNSKNGNRKYSHEDNQGRVKQLLDKIKNREQQILRLQRQLQFNGINMNKILKDFNDDRTKSKINTLTEQVKYLEEQNAKMKAQVKKHRNTGGLKEALRQQVRKNHAEIKKLDEQNKSIKRKIKQTTFDGKAQIKQNKRQLQKATISLEQQKQQNQALKQLIDNLEKKIAFLNKQANSLKNQLYEAQQNSKQKDILLDQIKNIDTGNKILEKYELENYRKRLEQSEDINKELASHNKMLAREINSYKHEGKIKSQAIENLQNIVEQLKKRNMIVTQELALSEQRMHLQKNKAEIMRQIANEEFDELERLKMQQHLINDR